VSALLQPTPRHQGATAVAAWAAPPSSRTLYPRSPTCSQILVPTPLHISTHMPLHSVPAGACSHERSSGIPPLMTHPLPRPLASHMPEVSWLLPLARRPLSCSARWLYCCSSGTPALALPVAFSGNSCTSQRHSLLLPHRTWALGVSLHCTLINVNCNTYTPSHRSWSALGFPETCSV
jgi:hypothetical protein